MRNRNAALLALLTCLFSTNIAQALDVPLTYERYADDEERYRPYGGNWPVPELSKPDGIAKAPDLLGDAPLFCSVKLADSEYSAVFARQRADDPFYNVLHFDQNGNGDLTDDPVVKGRSDQGRGDNYHATFPALDLEVSVNGSKVPYSVRPVVSSMNYRGLKEGILRGEPVRNFISVGFRLNCAYYGRIEADGMTCELALGDANVNGLFSDTIEIDRQDRVMEPEAMFAKGDFLYLCEGQMGHRDRLMLGKQLWFGGQLYDVSVDIAAKVLRLTPVDNGLCNVEFAMAPEAIVLSSEDNSQSVVLYRPEQEGAVPAGKYQVYSYRLRQKDKQGGLWHLEACASPESPFTEVRADADTKFVLGEPFVPLCHVPYFLMNMFRQGSTEVYIYFGVQGVAKEMVMDLTLLSGDSPAVALSSADPSRPKEPSYKVVTEDGETVVSGQFEYG